MNYLDNGKIAVGAPNSEARKKQEKEIGCSWCLPWRAGWVSSTCPDEEERCSCNPESEEDREERTKSIS